MQFRLCLIYVGLTVTFCVATNEVISEHYAKLEKVSAIPGSTVSIIVEYPPPNLPKHNILSFLIQNIDNKLNTNILHMQGGVSYNYLKAKIVSDKDKGMNFIWTVETVNENKTNEERLSSLLQDLINKEDNRNITSQYIQF